MEAVFFSGKRIRMGRIIKEFADGSILEYDKGSFDDWCVYLQRPNGIRRPPRDIDYFEQLKSFSNKYGVKQIYGDYVKVYNLTGKQIDDKSLRVITAIAEAYGEDKLGIDIIFSILYMAMIAEEQKAYTKLGKRIKRLGIHKLLIENRSVRESANFMRGMDWRDIDILCKERGF